jgi:predicted aspartyl protease
LNFGYFISISAFFARCNWFFNKSHHLLLLDTFLKYQLYQQILIHAQVSLYDNNEEKLQHIWFNVQLLVKQAPETNGNITVNVSNTWTVRAMVDTGATISGITSRMIDQMGLNPQREDEFTSANGNGLSPIYVFDVVFPGGKVFENIEAVEICGDGHSDFLIGMNILSQGDMAITSVNGKSAFSFRCPPAGKYIDFEEELNQ